MGCQSQHGSTFPPLFTPVTPIECLVPRQPLIEEVLTLAVIKVQQERGFPVVNELYEVSLGLFIGKAAVV